jgi:hypothetical protein
MAFIEIETISGSQILNVNSIRQVVPADHGTNIYFRESHTEIPIHVKCLQSIHEIRKKLRDSGSTIV